MSDVKSGAVVAKPQNWESVASPGHVLFAKADVLRLGFQPLYLKASLILLAVPIALYFSNKIGALVGDGVAKVVAWALWLRLEHFVGAFVLAAAAFFAWIFMKTRGLGKNVKTPLRALAGLVLAGAVGWLGLLGYKNFAGVEDAPQLSATPAPKLAQIAFVQGTGENDPDQIKNADQVRDLMLQWTAALDAGKPLPESDCISNKKIIEPWFGQADVKLRCRVSVDKTRIWVWGYSFASPTAPKAAYAPEHGGVAALAYKTKKAGWTVANLAHLKGRGISLNLAAAEAAAVKAAADAIPVDMTNVGTQRESEARRTVAEAVARERFNFEVRRIPRTVAADLPELVSTFEATPSVGTPSPAAAAAAAGIFGFVGGVTRNPRY